MSQIKENPMVIRQELQDDLLSSGICDTKWVVNNDIHSNNLKSCSPWKTLLLLKRNKDARLKFIHECKDKEKLYWEKVLWMDKTKIDLFGCNSKNHVWRKDGKAFKAKNSSNSEIWRWQHYG